MKLQLQSQLEQAKLMEKEKEMQAEMQRELMRQQAENERKAAELQSREAMNTSDNETAKLPAAAELETGEDIAVSTGTGINPNP